MLNYLDRTWKPSGSPTEVALLVLAMRANMTRSSLSPSWSMLAEFPFDSTIKMVCMYYVHLVHERAYLVARVFTCARKHDTLVIVTLVVDARRVLI